LPCPILCSPVARNGLAEFVVFACRFSVHSKVANLARTTPLHLSVHTGVSHDELSVIQYIVADEPVEKLRDLPATFQRFFVELL
jgi:hypothetical protein